MNPTNSELKCCPFCGGRMMFRKALWPSDGCTDAIIHAEPTDCGMVVFDTGTIDESVTAAWNTRTPRPDNALAGGAVELTDTTDLKARLRKITRGYGPREHMFVNPDGPEAADALDAKDRTIAGLREAFLETREFLSLLEPAVCDWSCPSKWRSGEPQPHSKLHHDLRDVLHKHETVAIALRDQRLARRMGAKFVPHDYDATPLKGQTP